MRSAFRLPRFAFRAPPAIAVVVARSGATDGRLACDSTGSRSGVARCAPALMPT